MVYCALSNLFDPFNTQSAKRVYCLLTLNVLFKSQLCSELEEFSFNVTLTLPVEILMP